MNKKAFHQGARFALASLIVTFSLVTNSMAAPQSSAEDSSEKVFGEVQKHGVGIGIGQTILMGNFDDYGDSSITLDALYTYSASYSFDLVANLQYSRHKYAGQKVILPALTSSIKAKAFQFDAFAPYVLGGLGFYRPKAFRSINGVIVESDSKWTFGINFGAGVDLKLNEKFTFGILMQYHRPFNVKQENAPKVQGSYTKLLLTTIYHF